MKTSYKKLIKILTQEDINKLAQYFNVLMEIDKQIKIRRKKPVN
jgi:hypothetical protein